MECEARQHYPRNMSNEEYKAIHSLSQNNQIIIKKADKGSNIVVMDTKDYIREGLRQLSDKECFECTHEDLTKKHYNEIKEVVESLHDNKEISKSTRDYLLSDGLRTAILYFLPKIHKNLGHPPGRPIESSNSSPSEKISQMADILMNEYVTLLPSTIKDTTDFLQKTSLIANIPEGAFVVSWDVIGLYPNIPTEDGIKASEWMLKNIEKAMSNQATNQFWSYSD